VRLRVTARGIKTIDKLGIEKVLADMRARGEKV
jgi:large subunit ribosomal protein L28